MAETEPKGQVSGVVNGEGGEAGKTHGPAILIETVKVGDKRYRLYRQFDLSYIVLGEDKNGEFTENHAAGGFLACAKFFYELAQ